MVRRNLRDEECRYRASIWEFSAVSFITASLTTFLLPMVNSAALKNGNPQILAWLPPFDMDNDWLNWMRWMFIPLFGAIGGVFAMGALLGIRRLLPESQRDRIVWSHPPRLPQPNVIEELPREGAWRMALVPPAIAALGTGLLVFIATRVQVDRTHRRPVVTWSGLSADQVTWLAVIAWALSAGAILLAFLELAREKRSIGERRMWLSAAGVTIGAVNLFFSCLGYCLIYED